MLIDCILVIGLEITSAKTTPSSATIDLACQSESIDRISTWALTILEEGTSNPVDEIVMSCNATADINDLEPEINYTIKIHVSNTALSCPWARIGGKTWCSYHIELLFE